jgi:putative transcriptional regulator
VLYIDAIMENRIRVMRSERDWTQGDLAQRLGVSRQTVNSIETGKYDPSLPLAFRIARVFGCPIEEAFLDPAGRPAGGPGNGRDENRKDGVA